MIDILVGLLVLAALVGLGELLGPNGPWKKRVPCAHGVKGDCGLCAAEGKRNLERYLALEGYKQEWEKLRRTEVKRLSQARLRSSEAYFEMGPREFEDAIAKVFRKLGYRVNQTVYVGDGGKDAIAWKDKKKYVIECKRYGIHSATGRRDLQILLAAKHDVEADSAIFVTTGRLTAPAIAYADENDVQCYDKDSFPDLINRAYGSPEDYAMAKTICLECGREAYLPLDNDSGTSGTAIHDGSRHEVRTSISISQLKYPGLDLDAPWCPDHQVPMRRVNGYRGPFWGCPEYPQCKNVGGSAARPPEVVEAEARGRRAELMNTYNAMKESTRERLRKEIEAELTQKGMLALISPDELPLIIAGRYSRGSR
ncbi:MAG: restriction endonuclease [Terracidiphilus sp.]